MRKRGRTLRMLLFGTMMVLVLVGWGKQPVQLLNETPPLIDLDAAIQEADFGNNGNTGEETGDPDVDHPGGNDGDTQQVNQNKTIVISIRDEELTYDNMMILSRSVDNLRRRLEKEYQKGDVIRLVDDFAEAHKYREVLAMLEALRSEKGFVYSAD